MAVLCQVLLGRRSGCRVRRLGAECVLLPEAVRVRRTQLARPAHELSPISVDGLDRSSMDGLATHGC